MQITNNISKYGVIHKILHWLIAVLFFCQLYWIMMRDYILPKESDLRLIYLVKYHKPVGVILLNLFFIMLIWRLINIKPAYPDTMPKWEKISAKIVQYGLYLIMFLMPLSGFLMNLYATRSINMFGLFTITPWVEKNKLYAGFFHEVHHYVGYLTVALILVHIAAALKHHFIEKDNVLKRMLWG